MPEDKHETEDTIELRGDKYVLLSASGQVLGTHATRAGAEAQERAIEAAKRREDSEDSLEFQNSYDVAPIIKAERDSNGFLRVSATVSSPGVFVYIRGGQPRRELKTADELFSPEHMRSVAGAVVTNEHPSGLDGVNPSNVGELQNGHSFSAPIVTKDGLDVDLVITDPTLIELIENRQKTGISLGKRNTFDATPGTWTADDGTQVSYDVVQRNMLTNHIAVVSMPRVPSAQLHLDSTEQDEQENTMADTVLLTIDGAELQVDKTVASIVKADQGRRDAALGKVNEKLAKASTTNDSLTKERDEAIKSRDTMEAERDDAREKLKTADSIDIDGLVSDRIAFNEKVRTVLTEDQFAEVKGKTPIEIMRFTCDSRGIKIEGKADAYVEGRFYATCDAVADGNNRELSNALANPAPTVGQQADHEGINKRLRDARKAG